MARLPARLRPLWPYVKAVHTSTAGLAAPLTSRLSAALGRGLPTGVALTPEASVRGGGRFEVAVPAEELTRSPPEGRPAGHWRFREGLQVTVPRVVTLELPGARVLGPHGAVVNAAHELVWPVSSYFGTDRPSRHPLYLHPLRPEPLHVPGRLAVLATRGDSNYYHFLLDVLPRLGVLERTPGIAPPDRFLVPAASAFQRELLALMGLSDDAVLDSTRHPHVQADLLIAPGLASADLQTAPWVVQLLRERLLTRAPGSVGRRLYVTRGRELHTRRVVNEDDVLTVLTARGFEPVDPGTLTVAEQIALFAEAEWIVSPHGAALANLTFASPGCTVLELFPADYVNTCYWALASQVPGLSYRYLVGNDRVGPRRERAMAGVSRDLTVGLGQLVGMLPP